LTELSALSEAGGRCSQCVQSLFSPHSNVQGGGPCACLWSRAREVRAPSVLCCYRRRSRVRVRDLPGGRAGAGNRSIWYWYWYWQNVPFLPLVCSFSIIVRYERFYSPPPRVSCFTSHLSLVDVVVCAWSCGWLLWLSLSLESPSISVSETEMTDIIIL